MKDQKSFLLDALRFADFRQKDIPTNSFADPQPAGEGQDAPPNDANPDWYMISGNEATSGQLFHYQERVADSPGPIRSQPINSEEPDSALVIFSLPKPTNDGHSFRMTVTLTNGEITDTVDMQIIAGNFQSLWDATPSADRVHQEAGVFFTVLDSLTNKYVTITNNNTETEVIRTECSRIDTYDEFRVSFLVRS